MFAAQQIPYNQANAFTKIVLDYLSGAEDLRPFYSHPSSIDGFKKAIIARQEHSTNRDALVQTLVKQYNGIETTELVKKNIQSLLSTNSFTICTAHQPNLFTVRFILFIRYFTQ
jgi:hypothetical protein